MAIRRANGDEIDYPNNQTKLEQGDRLLIVGADEELAALAELAKGQAVVPGENSACQWITVNADAPTLGKTLRDLDIGKQFGVQVQAMRRDGKYIRYPDGGMDLQVSDQVLLCGGLTGLSQLEQLFGVANKVPLSVPIVKASKAEALKEFLPIDNLRE